MEQGFDSATDPTSQEGSTSVTIKLCSEQNNMNLIMYGILAIGIALETGLFVLAKISDWGILGFIPIPVGVYLGAAGICHYSIHLNGVYMEVEGEKSIKDFEANKKNHTYNKYFIGFANLFILSVIVLPAIWASYESSAIVGCITLIIGLLLFVLSAPIAGSGWNKFRAEKEKLTLAKST